MHAAMILGQLKSRELILGPVSLLQLRLEAGGSEEDGVAVK